MNRKKLVILFVLSALAAVVYSLSGPPHKFSPGECSLCHFDENREPVNIKPGLADACEACHREMKETLTHPTNVSPVLSVPEDMPLLEGKLTCITCHYVHPRNEEQDPKDRFFLRRRARGVLFCGACHQIDDRDHIVLEKVHMGSYRVTDPSAGLDRMSIECIECHNKEADTSGAGIWSHSGGRNHPVGVSYKELSEKKMRKFHPASMLSGEIRLFDGRIGCGTCHNIYSREKFMLVTSNLKSRLCLECHIK